jgi:hypothetical protein
LAGRKVSGFEVGLSLVYAFRSCWRKKKKKNYFLRGLEREILRMEFLED